MSRTATRRQIAGGLAALAALPAPIHVAQAQALGVWRPSRPVG